MCDHHGDHYNDCRHCNQNSFIAECLMEDHIEIHRKCNWLWSKHNGNFTGNYCQACLDKDYSLVIPLDCELCGFPRCEHFGFKCASCDVDYCNDCREGHNGPYGIPKTCLVCSTEVCDNCLSDGKCNECLYKVQIDN